MQPARLDVLIYAHDGRGLGHASRSIGVGLALRRLYPRLKVLFVSGCNLSQQLIGRAPLDWLKLPSYQTTVIEGKSVGAPGKSLFTDEQLGRFRSAELAHLLSLYRPRLVLVDHTPQGKHRELVAALEAKDHGDVLWLLGVRGVVGAVRQAQSELSGRLFREHYHAALWYGDSSVLGISHLQQLEQHYATEPVECGYVLRLAEFLFWHGALSLSSRRMVAGTVSLPWLGERSLEFLEILAEVLKKIPQSYGCWRIYVDLSGALGEGQKIEELFAEIDDCILEPPGINYIPALLQSRVAVICGGYNSLMDAVFARIPAVVVLRDMADQEQQIHLQKLQQLAGESIAAVAENDVSVHELERLLLAQLQRGKLPEIALNIDGAANAAHYIYGLLAENT